MGLDDLVRQRLLRPHPADRAEIRSLLLAALRRCEDASNPSVHAETRPEQAYHAVLSCALVALRAKGYRPGRVLGFTSSPSETLAETLRPDPEQIDYYQALRRQRHQCLYEDSAPLRTLTSTKLSAGPAGLSGRQSAGYGTSMHPSHPTTFLTSPTESLPPCRTRLRRPGPAQRARPRGPGVRSCAATGSLDALRFGRMDNSGAGAFPWGHRLRWEAH